MAHAAVGVLAGDHHVGHVVVEEAVVEVGLLEGAVEALGRNDLAFRCRPGASASMTAAPAVPAMAWRPQIEDFAVVGTVGVDRSRRRASPDRLRAWSMRRRIAGTICIARASLASAPVTKSLSMLTTIKAFTSGSRLRVRQPSFHFPFLPDPVRRRLAKIRRTSGESSRPLAALWIASRVRSSSRKGAPRRRRAALARPRQSLRPAPAAASPP